MAYRLSLRSPASTSGWSDSSPPAEPSPPARHVPMAARFAVRLAGVVALVGGGIALGRGVVGLAGARSNPIEAAGASASPLAAAAPPIVSASTSPGSETASAQPVVASSLRSWAAPANVAGPSADVQPASDSSTSAAPSGLTEGAAYTVANGDTLSQIAQRFGTSTDALVRANALADPNVVVPGTVLSHPGGWRTG